MSEPTGPPVPDTAGLEGAGVFSSWADVGNAVRSGGPFELAFASAAAGLDTLGLLADPFGSLVSAGVGWAFEHISFLREPLDVLAGRPAEIVALGRSWHGVALTLTEVAAERRALLGWEGAAGHAFQVAAQAHADAMDAIALRADELAATLVTTGATIGTVRSVVRDLIADFVGWTVGALLTGAVAAAISGGVSVAAAVGFVVLDAIALASRIAERISMLLSSLAEAGRAVGRIASAMRSTGDALGTAALYAHYGAVPIDARIGDYARVVEAGKQFSTANGV